MYSVQASTVHSRTPTDVVIARMLTATTVIGCSGPAPLTPPELGLPMTILMEAVLVRQIIIYYIYPVQRNKSSEMMVITLILELLLH